MKALSLESIWSSTKETTKQGDGPLISVICVYNDKTILESCLLSSLQKSSHSYDLVLVDNTKRAYSSASEALNYGAKKAIGDYLLFVHQDVVFGDSFSLDELEEKLSMLPANSIVGAAGRVDRRGVITSITHGEPPEPAGSELIDRPTLSQTLDELLLVVHRRVFDKIKFDEDVCNGWHLYAVDFCLSAKKCDYESYVIPLDLHHRSSGQSMNKSYYSILKRVASKHRDRIPTIFTTMGIWKTSRIGLWISVLEMLCKTKAKRILVKTKLGRKLLDRRKVL